MKNYAAYQVEDFLTDDEFIDWVNHPTEQSNQFWSRWMADAVQGEKVRLAAATLKTIRFQATPVAPEFYHSLKQRIDTTVQQSQQVSPKHKVFWLNILIKVAAVFVLVIGGVFLLRLLLQQPKMIVLSTAYKEVKTVELPDHSSVTLNANSSLEYPEEWNNNNRNVTLKGEGFFKVAHLEKKGGAAKFTVHANAVQVNVLGTEFNVKARDENTAIMLQSGKVQLKVDGLNDSRIMKPNDFVLYNRASKQLTASVVNPSYYTAWIHHRYVFNKVPLKEICDHLEDYYGFRFAIKDSGLVNQEISGSLLLEDESSLLQTLSSLLNANIERQNNIVTISSKK